MRNENAITLVALVVTVIILLILAGITLNIVLVDNKLIDRAHLASNTYANSVSDELSMLGEYDKTIKSESTLVNRFKNGKIKVGDYINYTIPANNSYTSTATENAHSNAFDDQTFDTNNNGKEIKWRVLGLSDDEGKLTQDMDNGTRLMLIADNPLQKNMDTNSANKYENTPYFYMGKAEGCTYAKEILNEICSIYTNSEFADSARSIDIDDINNILGVTVDYDNGIVYKNEDKSKKNIDIIRTLGKIYNYKSEDYSATSFTNGKRKATENGENSVVANAYAYMIDSIQNPVIKDMLFDQVSGANEKAYWLASTATFELASMERYSIGEVSSNMVNLSGFEFSADGSWTVKGLGIRPIIILKRDITEKELSVVEKTTDKWNYSTSSCYVGTKDNYDTVGTEIMIY